MEKIIKIELVTENRNGERCIYSLSGHEINKLKDNILRRNFDISVLPEIISGKVSLYDWEKIIFPQSEVKYYFS